MFSAEPVFRGGGGALPTLLDDSGTAELPERSA
jgi:hypothetical protein